jgi:predicted helicase
VFQKYIEKISDTAKQGDAREESYYSALEAMLIEFAESIDKKDVHVTSQPKKTSAGNPDFRVWYGKQDIVGYIEAKVPEQDLTEIEKTKQIMRYKSTFPNFILTNFVEFRFFKDGLCVDAVTICDLESLYQVKKKPFFGNKTEFTSLLSKFFSFYFPSITSGKALAIELAKRTRFLRDEVIAEELREGKNENVGKILGFYEAFQRFLIKGLTRQQFADLYSQTITYGLFAARMRSEGDFNRKLAVHDIPRSLGILREMFDFISLGDLPVQLEWIVDDISNVLANVQVRKLFSDFYRRRKGEDPIFHFYETFLEEYDPEEREHRGVYYTPTPVVSYIVRSLNLILKDKFGLKDGLADERVTILDPAAGTLTFVAEAVKQAVEEFVSRYGEGGRDDFIKEHIMRNFYAFELMIAPYALGHVKISFLLEECGHKLREDERMQFFLTNTLELEDIEQTSLPGMASLAEESRKAGKVKKDTPIWIILGNPPYFGMSSNKGEWITDLVSEYKYVDGEPLGEKNPKWLLDDYVKFIRFAEWKINQMGRGIIGYITNHSFLDNPTFRGMRQHLMENFDEIMVLDLHGNTLKTPRAPDGGKDENVFGGIMQGVAISFFTKTGDRNSNSEVFHCEKWGAREKKYDWLLSNDTNSTRWTALTPHTPFYFFVPKKEKYLKRYNKFWKVTDLFKINSVGIVTARDSLTIAYTPEEAWKTVQDFSSLPVEQARTKYQLGKDVLDWKVTWAQEDLRSTGPKRSLMVPILYRPFDVRYTYYTGHSKGFHCRPRPEIMNNMLRENIALITSRLTKGEKFKHALVSNTISEVILLSPKTSNNGFVFPLYVYDETNEKSANINVYVRKSLEKVYGQKVGSRSIFNYIYSILFSNTYRTKYAEFLESDFPRIPFTKSYGIFSKMAELGQKLVDLHLMRSDVLAKSPSKFQGEGDRTVEKPFYDARTQRVYINDGQYFENVNKKAWEYQIGGYQVLSKWLKYRMQRELSFGDVKHFCAIVAVIKDTIEIQDKLDDLYVEVERDTIPFEKNSQNASLDRFAE